MSNKEQEVERNPDGTFPKGVSGNPLGRPKGVKNKITLLKQALELRLREQAAPDIGEVLEKAVEMAKEGHPGMIKLLLEMHLSKGVSEDKEARDKLEININSPSEIKPISVIDSPTPNEEE